MLGLARQGTTAWIRDSAGRLVGQNANGTRHYYLTDRLGSIVGLTDSSGTLAQTYKYEPYGLLRSSSGSVTNPFRFTGAYRTGSGFGEMYKLGARYYDPSIGRWTQQDPLDQPDDLRNGNRYAYAAADPVNYVDPDGTFPSLGEIVEKVQEVSRDVQGYFRVLNESPAGRLIRNCAIGGTAGAIFGAVAKIRKELFVVGCAAVNIARRGR